MNLWIDVSRPIKHGMVYWPGNPAPSVELVQSMADGAVCNVTRMTMSVHSLTHMDAMRHFVADGLTMEKMPLEAGIGPARVIEMHESAITRAIVEPHDPQPGERLLFKTSNSDRLWNDDEFHTDYVAVENDAAEFLVERGVLTVGVDYLSVAPWHDLISTHVTLLGAGVWVIEGLDLRAVEPGDYDLICLPLKIEGSDGAPCRVVLRRR